MQTAQAQVRCFRNPERPKTEQGSDQYQQQSASTMKATLKLIKWRMGGDSHDEHNNHNPNDNCSKPTDKRNAAMAWPNTPQERQVLHSVTDTLPSKALSKA